MVRRQAMAAGADRRPLMAVLTEAELVLGLSRHLSAYARGPERAALGELEFAGWRQGPQRPPCSGQRGRAAPPAR